MENLFRCPVSVLYNQGRWMQGMSVAFHWSGSIVDSSVFLIVVWNGEWTQMSLELPENHLVDRRLAFTQQPQP